jgi:hypothetical protein
MVCLYSCLNIKRMRNIGGCVMSGSTVFSPYPTNGKIFGKILLNMCLDFLHKFCLKHFSLQEEFSEISQPYTGLHVKCPLFLLDFNKTWIFLTDSRKNSPITNNMKIPPVELSYSVRMDRKTNITRLTVALRNFANALKNWKRFIIIFIQILQLISARCYRL